MKQLARSPLRYPGGKSRALARIFAQFPDEFSEFREPMVGGGSVFLEAIQRYPNVRVWINDLNPDVYCFWECARDHLPELTRDVRRYKALYEDGQALFVELRSLDASALSLLERAVRFFVLNRITFSGTIESGGYSEAAFQTRFTDSSIERLEHLGVLQEHSITITHGDYFPVTHTRGKNVFLFLDPPYESARGLYGHNGDMHAGFDHQELARRMAVCTHQWLITYGDTETARERFWFAEQSSWSLRYSMDNFKRDHTKLGRELFLRNYFIPAQIDTPAGSGAACRG